jgi:hypothetical protein
LLQLGSLLRCNTFLATNTREGEIVVACAIVIVGYFVTVNQEMLLLSAVFSGLQHGLWNSFGIDRHDVLWLGVRMREQGNGII